MATFRPNTAHRGSDYGQIIPPEEEQGYDEDGEGAADGALATLNRSEIEQQARWAIAHPRSLTKWRADLETLATQNAAIAAQMAYTLPRGGKSLVGPSTRFAEALVSVYGNCRAGARVIAVEHDYIVAQGVFFDCEKNTAIAIEVKRRITNRSGQRFDADMIQVTGNAACSIAYRNATFRGIPKAAWNDIYERSLETATGGTAGFQQRRDDAIARFNKAGITTAQLLDALSIPGIPDMTKEHVVALNEWTARLQRRETTLDELFGSQEQAQVESMMAELGWNEAKRSMSRNQYKGRTGEHHAYLRVQLEQHRAATGQGQGAEAAPEAKPEPSPAPKDAKPETVLELQPNAEPAKTGRRTTTAQKPADEPYGGAY